MKENDDEANHEESLKEDDDSSLNKRCSPAHIFSPVKNNQYLH